MKKMFIILLLFFSVKAISQTKPEIRLNVYASYVFDDAVDSYYSNTSYYEGTVKAGLQWGLGVEYMIRPTTGIELSYLREDTEAPTTYYDDNGIGNAVKTRDFDLAINYILLGSTRYFPLKPAIEPYFGAQLGVGIINISNPTEGDETSSTKFAWAIRAGTNIWVSQKIGIKLQAGLVSVSQAVGGGVYFGTGGIGAGATSLSSIYQFSLGGGLVFKFGGATSAPQQSAPQQ
jgi:opacity protein-like surface antigen